MFLCILTKQAHNSKMHNALCALYCALCALHALYVALCALYALRALYALCAVLRALYKKK